MLGKFVVRFRKANWDKAAARIGALASRHRDSALRGLFAAPPIKTAVAPKWATSQGEELVRIDSGKSIFDPQLVEEIGRKFESCAWIRKVTSVERVFPDRLLVKFEDRR